ncbi:MAG: hypothetical protein GY801_02460 [bacterium]|nr:hypothetical protein [bacterium]
MTQKYNSSSWQFVMRENIIAKLNMSKNKNSPKFLDLSIKISSGRAGNQKKS